MHGAAGHRGQDPVRVVSLVPAATDVLGALGVGAALVGATDDCRVLPGVPLVVTSVIPAGLDQAAIDALVSSRLRAGLPLREVRSELLRVLAPDVVVAQDLCAVCAVGTAETARALAMVGSPAVLHTYDPHRLADLVPAVGELAAACGLAAAGATLTAGLTERLDALRRRVAGLPQPRVVVLEWTDPLWAAGHWVPDVVAAAGGVEVLGVAGGRSVPVDRAAVLAAHPDVVVVAPCGLPLVDAVDAARTVTSWLAPGTRVLAADGTVLTGAGPGLVDLAEALAARLHPGAGARVLGAAPDSAVAGADGPSGNRRGADGRAARSDPRSQQVSGACGPSPGIGRDFGVSTVRPLRASDAAAVLRLQVEVEAADHDGVNYDLDDVVEELADPGLDLEADTVGIFDDELLLAQLRLHSHEGVLVISGAVDPAVRRRGHGTTLLGWARAQAVARGCRTLSARTNDGVPGAPALFARQRLVPVRRWFTMQRPLVPGAPVAVPAVAGLVTTPVDGAPSEQLRLLHTAVFSGHWGSEPPTPERWEQWFLGSPHLRRETSLLAREGDADGEIVGYALGYEWPADTVATGVREAWLGQLGVPAEHRRRGIGALLLASFVERAAAAGYGRVGLAVDTENTSNALALYEGAGFAATATFTTFEGPVG